MAESIKTQIGDLTGFASTDDAALQDWCDAGAKEIISVLPPDMLIKCVTASTLSNSPTTLTNLDTRGKIFAVTRSDGTRRKPCREILSIYRGMVNDSNDLLNYATSSDPVYLRYNNILEVYPVPTSSQTAHVEHTSFPTVNLASSEIGNFPDEAQYLVVLYASGRAIQRKLNDKSSDLPTLILPVAPIPPSAPSYTTPDIASISISNLGVPPTYTAPTVGGASEGLTVALTALTGDQIGTDADFLDVSKWFTALGEMIEDDEDIELAGAQIEKINSYIQSYNIAMQDQLNTFNDAATEYQTKTQEALQQAQINAQEAQSEANLKLQKETQEYSAELNKFQGEVGKYSAELNSNVQDFTTKLQKHSTDYQWLQGQYVQLKAEYQKGLQMLISGGLPQQQQGGK